MDADGSELRDDLTDEALRDEIELGAELVVAASSLRGRMPQEQVDSILGVPASEHRVGLTRSARP